MKQQLLQLFEIKGIKNANEFAKRLGYASPEKINRLLRDNNHKPSVDLITDIANMFADININWLLTGKGFPFVTAPIPEQTATSMVQEPEPIFNLIKKTAQIIPVVVDADGESLITIIDAQAAAGLPYNLENPVYWREKPHFRMPWPQFKSGDYILIQITGDSMTPTIYNGDWLCCKRINDYKEVRDGYIHIIVSNEGVVCKRVLNRVDKRQALALKSDNEQYPTYDQPISDVLQIWKVELKMSAVLRNENADVRKDVNHLKTELMEIKRILNNITHP